MSTVELGLIEGFFGRPWGWAERRETIEFLAPHGFGFYLYAPKADPFLRRRWQEPHPEGELAELAALSAACRRAGVRFGIGLSPFELYLEPESSWAPRLEEKLGALAEIGFDDLAILFDDMRGDVPQLAERQAAIVALAAEHAGGARIICCPSYYSDDPVLDRAFGARPAGYLEELGRRLDPAVEIMWTGEEVCARELTPGHLARVSEQMGRRPFLWDNYPVNDGPRMSQHLHLRAFTGRPAGIGAHVSAHGINVASQPVLSRIPALTLAESYAAGDAYEYGAAFERAAQAVLGPELGAQVRRDLLTLQDRGLDRLGDARAILTERYCAFDHPGAREIVAWLDGQWDDSGEAVQTQ
jgi:hypothetical protein